MGYLGRRIGLSQDNGDSTPGAAGGAVGGGLLDLFAHGYFERQGDLYNAPGAGPQSGLTATGGIISDYPDGGSNIYRAHVFTSSGELDVTALGSFTNTVEYLVIAGGGGGGSEGSQRGGGGGAGGYRTNVPAPIGPGDHTTSAAYPVSVSPYTVTIGAGGAGSPSGQGNDGANSVFGTITSSGGGGGGQGSQDSPPANEGRPGGSGGGGGSTAGPNSTEPGGSTIAVTTPSPWPGPATQGFAGGQGQHASGSWAAGGGGGGAGEVGHAAQHPNTTSGDGGDGLSNLITGPLNDSVGVVNPASPGRWFAGGGAGMHFGGGLSVGGAGGGGSTSHPGVGDSGVYATGGGGACGTPGGGGGSGIVVVRYKIAEITAQAKATGGSISFYGSKTIHAFVGSGNFVNPAQITNAEFVLVGGGGGGGYPQGGGGGAGGMVVHEGPFTIPAATNAVVVGAGGPGAQTGANPGTTTTLTFPGTPVTYSAYRGGGSGPSSTGSEQGGSGAGGSYNGGSGKSAINPASNPGASEYGNDGAAHSSTTGGGGGGAGGSAPGSNGIAGAGRQLPTTYQDPASTVGAPAPGGNYYVAGGGAAFVGGPGTPANSVGGGGGGGPYSPGPEVSNKGLMDGKANTGGGGAGPTVVTTPPAYYANYMGSGGSGIVLIAYPS